MVFNLLGEILGLMIYLLMNIPTIVRFYMIFLFLGMHMIFSLNDYEITYQKAKQKKDRFTVVYPSKYCHFSNIQLRDEFIY